MKQRIVVVPLIRDERGAYLLCRMAPHRGVFPGQWGLPGGGIEPGETMLEALRREIREETGLELQSAEQRWFKDATHWKAYADGTREPVYMIFLLFDCVAAGEVRLNEEFTDHAWVLPDDLGGYELNVETVDTFQRLGILPAASIAGDERELRAAIQRFGDAFNRGDVAGLMQLHTDHYVDVNLREPEQTRAERTAYYERVSASGLQVDVVPHEIQVLGDIALIRGAIRVAGSGRPDVGAGGELRFLEVWRRTPSGWRAFWGMDGGIQG